MPDTVISTAAPFPFRGSYTRAMAAICVVAIGAAALIPLALGGGSNAAMLAAATITVGGAATFLPVVLLPVSGNFGVLVVFTSGLRMLLVLGLALAFDQTRTLARTPFWLGVLSGAGLILIAESLVAVSMLSRTGRQLPPNHRLSAPAAPTVAPPPTAG
ncbi:MAG: hypothetical protein H7Y88_00165 [Phycisphaerales bacterium]|nr:hypothetical protein [Phycisphaerales bacterium]